MAPFCMYLWTKTLKVYLRKHLACTEARISVNAAMIIRKLKWQLFKYKFMPFFFKTFLSGAGSCNLEKGDLPSSLCQFVLDETRKNRYHSSFELHNIRLGGLSHWKMNHLNDDNHRWNGHNSYALQDYQPREKVNRVTLMHVSHYTNFNSAWIQHSQCYRVHPSATRSQLTVFMHSYITALILFVGLWLAVKSWRGKLQDSKFNLGQY